jgi:hypothetical protein
MKISQQAAEYQTQKRPKPARPKERGIRPKEIKIDFVKVFNEVNFITEKRVVKKNF